MDTLESRLKEAVKPWLGTPFRELHCVKGIAVDCANIVVAVLKDSGETIPDVGEPTFGYSKDDNYKGILDRFMKSLIRRRIILSVDDEIQSGDILLFRYDRRTQHLTLALDARTMVSVHQKSDVSEVTIDDRWMQKLIGHYRLTIHI